MSTQEEMELDKLSRKIVRKAGMETPSDLLKSKIMETVKAEDLSYEVGAGLLSNGVKIAIGIGVLTIGVATAFLPKSKELPQNLTEKYFNIDTFFEQISMDLPSMFLYGLTAFGLLFMIHIAYLKYQMDHH